MKKFILISGVIVFGGNVTIACVTNDGWFSIIGWGFATIFFIKSELIQK